MKLIRFTRDLAGEGIRCGDERVLPDELAAQQVAAGNGEVRPSPYDGLTAAGAGVASEDPPPTRPHRHYRKRDI